MRSDSFFPGLKNVILSAAGHFVVFMVVFFIFDTIPAPSKTFVGKVHLVSLNLNDRPSLTKTDKVDNLLHEKPGRLIERQVVEKKDTGEKPREVFKEKKKKEPKKLNKKKEEKKVLKKQVKKKKPVEKKKAGEKIAKANPSESSEKAEKETGSNSRNPSQSNVTEISAEGKGEIPPYYIQLIRSKIGVCWENPYTGETRRLETTIMFRIQRDGTVSGISTEKRSGKYIFDQAAIRAVNCAAPFPPVPPSMGDGFIDVHFTFRFIGDGD